LLLLFFVLLFRRKARTESSSPRKSAKDASTIKAAEKLGLVVGLGNDAALVHGRRTASTSIFSYSRHDGELAASKTASKGKKGFWTAESTC
jgi:hypothetical protein